MPPDASPVPPGALAATALGVAHTVVRHGPVRSLAEAATARGVEPADVVKTLVVRRGEGDHVLVLVPGDRTLSWPKLRALLGVSRMSLPDAEAARDVTGYVRGTITPFGARGALPVVADERLRGRRVTLGTGEHGSALLLDAHEALAALGAQVADVTEPEVAQGRLSAVAAATTASACRRPGERVRRSSGPLTDTAATTPPSGPRTGADTDATPCSRSATLEAHPRRRTSARTRGVKAADSSSGSPVRQASSTWAADPAVSGREVPTGTVSRRPLPRSAAATHTRRSPARR